MKLYKNVSRRRFLRSVPRYLHARLRWALTVKPGDLINDCSGFNVEVESVEIERIITKHGWFIYNVSFTTKPHGSCSWRHCGVEPPLSPKQIEKRFKEFYDEYKPYGGWDTKTEKDIVWVRMKNGLPICDDQGKILRQENEHAK